jgi:hypothetical protein
MAEQIVTSSIVAPGFKGVNTQDSSVTLESGYATIAENCVIDKFGRIGARKGWSPVNATSVALSTASIRTIVEMVKEDGNVVLTAGNNKLFSGTTTLTQLAVRNSANTADLSYTITDDHWSIGVQPYSTGKNASAHAYLAQAGHPTLIYHKLPLVGTGATITVTNVTGGGKISTFTVTTGGSNWFVGDSVTVTGGTGSGATFTVASVSGTAIVTLTMVTDGTGYTINDVLTLVDVPGQHTHEGSYGLQRLGDVGSLPAGYTTDTFTPNIALAAYGRIWYADIVNDRQTVYFSDLNSGSALTGGSSGSLNIADIVPDGDPIVALAAHNGYLVIFCKHHIVLYNNAEDVTNIALQDLIKGIGCIARDSVALAGTDLVFLSNGGVRSLLRTIQEKSSPIRDISANVRDDLMRYIDAETTKQVKSVYYEKDAFYAISFPTSNIVYCFDARGVLENGASRTTTWYTKITAFFPTVGRLLYLGKDGYIGNYTGYSDNGASYRMSYYTNWFDFNQPTVEKILKRIGITFIGGRGVNVSLKWAFDYSESYQSQVYTLANPSVAEYGIAEYGIAEYTAGVVFDNTTTQVGGTGRVIQIGIEAMIVGSELSVQKMDCYVKQGRIR